MCLTLCSFSLWTLWKKKRVPETEKSKRNKKCGKKGNFHKISFLEYETCECLLCYDRCGSQDHNRHKKCCRFLLVSIAWTSVVKASSYLLQFLLHHSQFPRISLPIPKPINIKTLKLTEILIYSIYIYSFHYNSIGNDTPIHFSHGNTTHKSSRCIKYEWVDDQWGQPQEDGAPKPLYFKLKLKVSTPKMSVIRLHCSGKRCVWANIL